LSHIPDLHEGSASLLVLLNVDVDGEMRVDVAHLVLVSLGNTGDQVLDEGPDGPQGGDVLADTMVQLDADNVGALGDEGDSEVLEVLDELATGSGNSDDAGLDGDGDYNSGFPSAPCSRTKYSPKIPPVQLLRSLELFPELPPLPFAQTHAPISSRPSVPPLSEFRVGRIGENSPPSGIVRVSLL
jgi:hypothetical protein